MNWKEALEKLFASIKAELVAEKAAGGTFTLPPEVVAVLKADWHKVETFLGLFGIKI